MTLADRLNRIITEQEITKRNFAATLGISENYVYLLTGNAKKRPDHIAPSLAKRSKDLQNRRCNLKLLQCFANWQTLFLYRK